MASVSQAAFHGRSTEPKSGRLLLQEEKPIHRLAARLLSEGLKIDEVAATCEVSDASVTNWLKAPWFQERVDWYIKDKCQDVMAFFEQQALRSAKVLVELRDNPKTSPTVRRLCACDILDRHLGKPTQNIHVERGPISDDPVAEVRRLEEANARLKEPSKN
jgi:hypothetical protein